MSKVYLLKVDNSQIIDDFPNIHKIKEDDYLDLSQVLASDKYELNEKEVILRGNFNQLSKYDFIQNELNIPVLSKNIIDLLELNSVKWLEVISMILLDDTVTPNKIFKLIGNGIRKEVPKNEDFYTIKFTKQFEDYCDLEKSSFRKLRSQPEGLGILKKPVLKEPKGGFPSLFKIRETVSMLFISEEAKQTLESNDIKGCLFEEVEVTPYES